MLGKVYSFLDWDGWSGERVVLRPDGTIPVARLYIDLMQRKDLARLFYVTNVFIFEHTGTEARERWQCGAELIGVGSPLADVELITLALEVLKQLGLEHVELRLSHAGLIRALLKGLGLTSEEQTRVFDQMLDGNLEALAGIKAGKSELERSLSLLLNLKGQSAGFLRNAKALFDHNLPELSPQVDNFVNIIELLESLGCAYHIDIASGRGFEYYTGVIFQLFMGDEKIGGGGRYDALIPLMGGPDIPASGLALYLDHLMNLIKPQALARPSAQRILIRAEPSATKESFSIASRLRDAGYVAELNLRGQEEADTRWTLDVQGKAPRLVLTNQTSKRRSEAESTDEVLGLLQKMDDLP
jgi:histidyl-tRNA synthetase